MQLRSPPGCHRACHQAPVSVNCQQLKLPCSLWAWHNRSCLTPLRCYAPLPNLRTDRSRDIKGDPLLQGGIYSAVWVTPIAHPSSRAEAGVPLDPTRLRSFCSNCFFSFLFPESAPPVRTVYLNPPLGNATQDKGECCISSTLLLCCQYQM